MTDEPGRIGNAPPETRKELIDYYKWMVSLAVVILTVSISLMGLLDRRVEFPWVLVAGWCLLGLSAFLNWLLVKRLVTIPIVTTTPSELRTRLHDLFEDSMWNVKAYGFIQNLGFLVGAMLVATGLVLNVNW